MWKGVAVEACHKTKFLDANVSIEREHVKRHISFFAYDLIKSASIPFNFKFNSKMFAIIDSDVNAVMLALLGDVKIENHDV